MAIGCMVLLGSVAGGSGGGLGGRFCGTVGVRAFLRDRWPHRGYRGAGGEVKTLKEGITINRRKLLCWRHDLQGNTRTGVVRTSISCSRIVLTEP